MALPSITLWPSNDTEKLVSAIAEANRDNKRIILRPGPHLTKPGIRRKIQIGPYGLHISGTLSIGEFSSIRRPVNSIALPGSDDNYGLYFIPSKPANAEWSTIPASEWKNHTHVNGEGETITFDYVVRVRGAITIENLELDCNMGNQGLPAIMESKLIEHSAMLAFSGEKYTNPDFPGKVIFVGFESVTLTNIRTVRGGYADDIWFNRGYFRPNIGKVLINKITSHNRVHHKRATVGFSGLTQQVEISNANIYSLEAEATAGGLWE